MKTMKNNVLVLINVCMMVLFSASGVFAVLAGGVDVSRPIISVVIGAVMLFGMLLLKEKHLHKAAPVIYAAVICVLCAQLCSNDPWNIVSQRYLYIYNVAVYTAAFLPLTYIQTAKMIGRYTDASYKKLFFIISSMALPVVLVFFQENMSPALIACVAAYVTVIVMKIEKKINLPWLACLLPLVLAVIAVGWIGEKFFYLEQTLLTILTRGQNDPFGAGWMRTNLDAIFMNTPFIGATNHSVAESSVAQMLVSWGRHNLMVLLAEYGWLVFLILIAMYICFFVVLFRMVHKTRQSTFARYTSLMLALSLLIHSIYSLLGISLLTHSTVDMPFLSSSYIVNAISYLSFGIILTLYMDRNKVSVG